MTALDGADSLYHRRFWRIDVTIFIGNYLQAVAVSYFQQLTLSQQEIRIGWLAKLLIPQSEGFIEQDTV